MNRILTYFIFIILGARLLLWHLETKHNYELQKIFTEVDNRKIQLDSLKKIGESFNLNHDGNAKSDTSLQVFISQSELGKTRQHQLLKESLDQYLKAQTKVNRWLNTIEIFEMIINVIIIVTLLAIVFWWIKSKP